MKTLDLDSLPVIQDWEKHMHVKLIAEFPVAPFDDFLSNYEFGKKLIAGKTTEVQSFRVQCREFMDKLIFVLVERISATASV